MWSGGQNPGTQPTGLTPEQREYYDLIREQREIGAEAQAVASEISSLEKKETEHVLGGRTADGEYRSERGVAEQLSRQLKQMGDQINEGWNQLKLFADKIYRKEDLAWFMWDQAIRESIRWFTNWLFISLGNIKNDQRKIMARLISLFILNDAAAIRGTSAKAQPLELGTMSEVTQPPDQSYQRALHSFKELESDKSSYYGEQERLLKKQNELREYEQDVAEHERRARESKSKTDHEKRLSKETKSQLAMLRSRLDGHKEGLRRIERRMNEIKRSKGVDPTA